VDAQQATAVYASYGHCIAIRSEEAIEDISGLLQLFRKLLLAHVGCSILAASA